MEAPGLEVGLQMKPADSFKPTWNPLSEVEGTSYSAPAAAPPFLSALADDSGTGT